MDLSDDEIQEILKSSYRVNYEVSICEIRRLKAEGEDYYKKAKRENLK
jgi:hypothetical protein